MRYGKAGLADADSRCSARAVLIARSNDPEVRREIAALLGSLGGNLSNEQVLEKLKALRVGASSKTKFRHSR